jgi:hypothetical protein
MKYPLDLAAGKRPAVESQRPPVSLDFAEAELRSAIWALFSQARPLLETSPGVFVECDPGDAKAHALSEELMRRIYGALHDWTFSRIDNG